MRILIIDISGEREKLFIDIIDRYHFNVETADTTKKSDTIIKEFKPHLLAINLSSNEEWAYLGKLKLSKETKAIPIVGITEDREKMLEYSKEYDLLEIFMEPVKLKNVRHAIQRWTHYGSLYRNNSK